ncbi:hypothetical protein [Leptothermofonsia sp. ETS-13]|uniref:hypothetical protein n=1 Tax=Leptothermofonsia sp. ETS-13 TaxID=3035696 RepID=UPI003B9DF0ED
MEDLAYIHLAWNEETAQAIDVGEMAVPKNSASPPAFAGRQMVTEEVQPAIDGDRDYTDFPGFSSDLYPTIYF